VTAPAPPCPGCGADVPFNPRYPGRFCETCLRDRATDHAGKRLKFVEDFRAAIGWQREDETSWTPATAVCCLISGHRAMVHAARFGGIVALPAETPALPRLKDQTDLSRP
jgi:predicted amidophosphoribosyltransferase